MKTQKTPVPLSARLGQKLTLGGEATPYKTQGADFAANSPGDRRFGGGIGRKHWLTFNRYSLD